MQKRHPGEGGAVLLGGERVILTKSTPETQPATLRELRALHLVARHHARPELALALAALVYDGGRR